MDSSTVEQKKTFHIAVVGATGAVGREIINMLESRKFPVKSLRLLASRRSQGSSLPFGGHNVRVDELKPGKISGLDIAIFSAGAEVSKEFSPLFSKEGVFVIDNSSAWRMVPSVPLVVPEVNPGELSKDKRIIANPNCSTIQLVVALKPIHDVARVKSIRVATYQAVSGAGGGGIADLTNQTQAWVEGKEIPPSKKIVKQIAFNVVPQIDDFSDSGYTKEEMKMVFETRKILDLPGAPISATCVRVPVYRGHSEAVWVETEKPIAPKEARDLLQKAPGLVVEDDPEALKYPTPISACGHQETFVGRIREDLVGKNGLVMWIVSDNLLKGAALNAVQIAELLVKKRFL